jgi:spore coat protein H
LRALIAALRQPDVTQRWADLQNVLDLDRFISFMAMEIIQCHWDGYTMNKNNWRLFHDLGANKMVFLPHGLDQMFGVERVGPDCPIFPRMGGVVARAIVANPEGRRRYVARLSELTAKVFNAERVADRVDVLAAQLQPVIAEFSPEGARRHQQEVEWLKERIRQRGESLKRQLAEAGG